MQGLKGQWIGALGLTCAIGIAGWGCGGDDDDSGMDSGTIGGTGGVSSGTGGTGSGGMTGSGGTTGSGGRSGGTGGMMAGAMCDTTIETTATCGGTSCPAAGGMASAVCSVPCCLTNNTCGFRRAMMGAVTDCVPVATPDSNCPDMMSGMTMSRGCCAVSGRCGVISGIDMTCITSSVFLPNLMPGDACEPGDGGTADGG
jgi:hypothetical protein